jgi:hypothetical protein
MAGKLPNLIKPLQRQLDFEYRNNARFRGAPCINCLDEKIQYIFFRKLIYIDIERGF